MTARCWWLARILLKDKSIGEIVLPVGDQMERMDPIGISLKQHENRRGGAATEP